MFFENVFRTPIFLYFVCRLNSMRIQPANALNLGFKRIEFSLNTIAIPILPYLYLVPFRSSGR